MSTKNWHKFPNGVSHTTHNLAIGSARDKINNIVSIAIAIVIATSLLCSYIVVATFLSHLSQSFCS